MTSPDDPSQDPVDDGFVVDTRGRGRESAGRVESNPVRAIPQAGSGRAAPAPPERPERGRRVADPPSSTAMDDSADPPTGAPRPERPERTGVSARMRRRRIVALVLLLLVAWVVFMIATPLSAWNSIRRVDAAPSGDRPAAGSGSNYLLVGSDSREGLTAQEAQDLSTGTASEDPGRRTDSILLVHVPASSTGKPALVSIPRDSYVPIPGMGKNKINAAYAFGGAKLLVGTVEQATGLHIDGYVEIGFSGFASVVDALGGVDICVPFDMNDPNAGINLKKGCQSLDGKNALGFVRARYSDPRGDIGRAERQRDFLAAIMQKAVQPSTLLLAARYWGFTHSMADGLRISEGMSMMEAKDMFLAMKAVSGGGGVSTVVPIADAGYRTSAGLAVKWDSAKALDLFHALRDDQSLTAS